MERSTVVAQNLPGKWEPKFNLPQALIKAIPKLNKHDTTIVMHNDAVVQGLSERPFMNDVTHWACLPSARAWGTRGLPTGMKMKLEPEVRRKLLKKIAPIEAGLRRLDAAAA